MKYTWNAENRLIAVEPGSPTDGDRKVVFAYDYKGRRVRKQVYVYASTPTPGWTPEVIEERRFVWHDWLMLEELSGGTGSGGGPGEPTGAPAENEPVRQYTWGLDIAGAAVAGPVHNDRMHSRWSFRSGSSTGPTRCFARKERTS